MFSANQQTGHSREKKEGDEVATTDPHNCIGNAAATVPRSAPHLPNVIIAIIPCGRYCSTHFTDGDGPRSKPHSSSELGGEASASDHRACTPGHYRAVRAHSDTQRMRTHAGVFGVGTRTRRATRTGTADADAETPASPGRTCAQRPTRLRDAGLFPSWCGNRNSAAVHRPPAGRSMLGGGTDPTQPQSSPLPEDCAEGARDPLPGPSS